MLFYEDSIKLWQILTLLSRDIGLFIFCIYLTLAKKWANVVFKAIFWGKVATAIQFVILVGITLKFHFPLYVYGGCVVIGVLAFIELITNRTYKKPFKIK